MGQTEEIMARKQVDQVVLDVFGKNPREWTEAQRRGSLFSQDLGFEAIDLMVLFRELEQRLGISFDTQDVTKQRFDIYENIIATVERKTKERSEII